MVGLVEDLVEYWKMKPTMNPVDTIVSKQEETWWREQIRDDKYAKDTYSGTESIRYVYPYVSNPSYSLE